MPEITIPIPDWNAVDREKYESWVQQIGPQAVFPVLARSEPDFEGKGGSLVPTYQQNYMPPPTQSKPVTAGTPTGVPDAWQWPSWNILGTGAPPKLPGGFPWWLLLLILGGGAYWYYSKKSGKLAYNSSDELTAKTWRERLLTMGLMFGFGLLKGTGEAAAQAAAPLTKAQVAKIVAKYQGEQSGAASV